MITVSFTRLNRFMGISCVHNVICPLSAAKVCLLKAKPKIGIFAGTFDPVHDGHLAFARAALDHGLEKVMFLPEPRPRRKQGVKAMDHRAAMVQLAVQAEPQFGTIVLQQARFSPAETLPILQKRFKGYELVLLFGDDVIRYMVDHIASWPHIEDLARSASLLIAARHEDRAELIQKLEELRTDYDLPFRYEFVEPNRKNISSSKIRLAAKRHQPLVGLPPPVAGYITDHKLYASGEIIS